MPAIVYVFFIGIMMAATYVSKSMLVAIYFVIGFLLSQTSIKKVVHSEEWKHDKWYTSECFAYVLILWPLYLIICFMIYMNSKKE